MFHNDGFLVMFADRFLKNFMKFPMPRSLKFRVKLVDSPCFFPKCQNHHETFALKQDLPLTTKAGENPQKVRRAVLVIPAPWGLKGWLDLSKNSSRIHDVCLIYILVDFYGMDAGVYIYIYTIHGSYGIVKPDHRISSFQELH